MISDEDSIDLTSQETVFIDPYMNTDPVVFFSFKKNGKSMKHSTAKNANARTMKLLFIFKANIIHKYNILSMDSLAA